MFYETIKCSSFFHCIVAHLLGFLVICRLLRIMMQVKDVFVKLHISDENTWIIKTLTFHSSQL